MGTQPADIASVDAAVEGIGAQDAGLAWLTSARSPFEAMVGPLLGVARDAGVCSHNGTGEPAVAVPRRRSSTREPSTVGR